MNSISERLILGVKSPILAENDRRLLKKIQPGGIILFDRNTENFEQLKALVREINLVVENKPFIAIDFEGGRVRRGKEIFNKLESPEFYKDKMPDKLKAHAAAVASQFRKLGINLNFAPVADLDYQPLNPALKGRVYSSDFQETAEYCHVFIEAFSGAGVLCCLKHFPGLGSAANDPHQRVSVSCLPISRLMEHDINSFRAGIDSGAAFLMTTHVVLTDLDNVIATYSEKVIQLARAIGFEGVIITDDLSMGAVADNDLPERVLKALTAGHDMALVCHNLEMYAELVDYLERYSDDLLKRGHERSLDRIRDAKKKLS